MTRERLKMLMDLVMDLDAKSQDKPYNAIIEITKHHIDVSIQNSPKDIPDGVYVSCYSTNSVDSISHGIRLVDDPELEQAETHLMKLMGEMKDDTVRNQSENS